MHGAFSETAECYLLSILLINISTKQLNMLQVHYADFLLSCSKSVGFVAAAVSMPMGGCRAIRPVVDMSVTVEPAVL